ncbi:MAG: hypothetical protein ACREL6_07150, partial [Gemmatimonadales bacterium]
MRRSHVLKPVGTALALLVAVGCATDNAVAPPAGSPAGSISPTPMTPIPGQYILVMEEGREGGLSAATASVNSRVRKLYPAAGLATVSGLSSAEVAQLAKGPGVAGVAQDMMVQWIPPREGITYQTVSMPVTEATNQSGAFFFDQFQWYLRVTKADQAYATTNGGQGALVCI